MELLVLDHPPHHPLDGDLAEVELVEVVECQLQLLDVVQGDRVQGVGLGIVILGYKCMENSSLVPVSPA